MQDTYFIWSADALMLGPAPFDAAEKLTSDVNVKFRLRVRFLPSEGMSNPTGIVLDDSERGPQVMVVPSFRGNCSADLLALRTHVAARDGAIDIIRVGKRTQSRAFGGSLNDKDLLGLILQGATINQLSGPATVSYIRDALDRQNSAVYATQYEHFASTLNKPFVDLTAEDLRNQVAGLQETRAEYAIYLMIARKVDTEQNHSNWQLESMLQTLDGLSTSILIGQIHILSESNADLARQAEERRGKESDRDRLLARWGLILILPGLLFSFLGINVLPTSLWGQPMASLRFTAMAALGGLLASLAGLVLVKLIFRYKKVRDT